METKHNKLFRFLIIGFIVVPLVLIPSAIIALIVALIGLVWSK